MASTEAYTRIKINDRETWLKTRQKLIQASESAAICNCSPWMDKTRLWDEKQGIVAPKDISNRSYVQYGKEMEQHIRAQFLLDNPYFSCEYHEFDILVSKARPWQGCTLDGELTVIRENPWDIPIGEMVPFEAKTGHFKSYDDYKEWCLFPMYYYTQVCHHFSVTGCRYEFTASRIIRDPFKEEDNGFPEVRVIYHLFRRSEPQLAQDIEIVEEKETDFYQSLLLNERPALTLSF